MNTVLPEVLPETGEQRRSEVEEIPPYKVVFLDDPKTSMEFVVRILIRLFGKDTVTAQRLMWEVHTQGSALVSTLPKEQAELKQEQVHTAARSEGFPFRCVIEPA